MKKLIVISIFSICTSHFSFADTPCTSSTGSGCTTFTTATNATAQVFKINKNGEHATFDNGTECKVVTNSDDKEVFFPVRTAAEWTANMATHPTYIGISDCPTGASAGVWVNTSSISTSPSINPLGYPTSRTICSGPSTTAPTNGDCNTIGETCEVEWKYGTHYRECQ